MANIILTGDTSGAITVAVPAAAGTNTITMPAETGTVITSGTAGAAGNTGTILQVVSVTPDPGAVSTTNSTWAELDTDLRLAITPKASDSTLILTCTFMFGGNNNTGIGYHKFYDVTNTSDVNLGTAGSRQGSHTGIRDMSNDLNDCVMINMMTTVSAATITARTYTIYNRCENTTARYYFANASDSSALGYAKPIFTIMEVSA